MDFIGNKTINFSLRVSLLFTNAGYKVRRVSSAHNAVSIQVLPCQALGNNHLPVACAALHVHGSCPREEIS